MNFLLDTQVALWAMMDNPRLSELLRTQLGETKGSVVFHQVSLWEIQIKFELGKLKLPAPPAELLPNWISETGFAYRKIEDTAIFMLGKLPSLHRDPFDRLLIGHAIVNGWTLVTADAWIPQYPVSVLRA